MKRFRTTSWLIRLTTLVLVLSCAWLAGLMILRGDAVMINPSDSAMTGVSSKTRVVVHDPSAKMMDYTSHQHRLALRAPVRQRLFDPPPKVVKPPAPPPPPPLRIKLLATILGDGEPRAMISDVRGNVTFVNIGQTTGDGSHPAKVLEIHDNHLLLEHAGRQVELRQEAR